MQYTKIKALKIHKCKDSPKIKNKNDFSNDYSLHRYIILPNNSTTNIIEKIVTNSSKTIRNLVNNKKLTIPTSNPVKGVMNFHVWIIITNFKTFSSFFLHLITHSDESVAERIVNRYLVRELFCHWNFEMIHFIQLEWPMPFYPGTPHRAP